MLLKTTLGTELTATGGAQCVGARPDFVIAGERRCGTTSLYHWMRRHPDVYLHARPDMNYFVEDELSSRAWLDGEVDAARWERTHRPEDYAALFRDGAGRACLGHKGADLLFWRPAHERLARFLPEGKFIITLRHPVTRAWSHYWNEVGKGRETLSFDEALAAEERRAHEHAFARFHLSYLARGFYERSLSDFFRRIPDSRVLVVTVEQSRLRPQETLGAIYRFIDVDPARGLELAGTSSNENWTTVPRAWASAPGVRGFERYYTRLTEAVITRSTNDPYRRRRLRTSAQRLFRRPASSLRMPETTRARLSKIYEPHVAALESLLGRRFSEWDF